MCLFWVGTNQPSLAQFYILHESKKRVIKKHFVTKMHHLRTHHTKKLVGYSIQAKCDETPISSTIIVYLFFLFMKA